MEGARGPVQPEDEADDAPERDPHGLRDGVRHRVEALVGGRVGRLRDGPRPRWAAASSRWASRSGRATRAPSASARASVCVAERPGGAAPDVGHTLGPDVRLHDAWLRRGTTMTVATPASVRNRRSAALRPPSAPSAARPRHGRPVLMTDPPTPTPGSIRSPRPGGSSTPAASRITAARERDSRTASQTTSAPVRRRKRAAASWSTRDGPPSGAESGAPGAATTGDGARLLTDLARQAAGRTGRTTSEPWPAGSKSQPREALARQDLCHSARGVRSGVAGLQKSRRPLAKRGGRPAQARCSGRRRALPPMRQTAARLRHPAPPDRTLRSPTSGRLAGCPTF